MLQPLGQLQGRLLERLLETAADWDVEICIPGEPLEELADTRSGWDLQTLRLRSKKNVGCVSGNRKPTFEVQVPVKYRR